MTCVRRSGLHSTNTGLASHSHNARFIRWSGHQTGNQACNPSKTHTITPNRFRASTASTAVSASFAFHSATTSAGPLIDSNRGSLGVRWFAKLHEQRCRCTASAAVVGFGWASPGHHPWLLPAWVCRTNIMCQLLMLIEVLPARRYLALRCTASSGGP